MFILFLIWVLFPDGEYRQSLALSDFAAGRLDRYHDALDVLNSSRWGDFDPTQPAGNIQENGTEAKGFIDLRGFRQHDGFAWEDLQLFRDKGLKLSRHAVPAAEGKQGWDAGMGGPMWLNASGTVHGDWVRSAGSVFRGYDSYNLSQNTPDLDWIGDQNEWARNVTGRTGRMMLMLNGNKSINSFEQLGEEQLGSWPRSGGMVRNVRATATVEDTTGSGLNWEMKLWGLHWPRQGVIMLTTTSEKFEGIFGLPHLAPGPDFFQSGQALLNRTLWRVVRRKERNVYVDQHMPWSSDLQNPMYTPYPSPHCEYVIYAQVHPPTSGAQQIEDDTLRAIESELQEPLGAPIPRVPNLRMSTVVYSPDCAFFLESKGPPDFPPSESNHLVGMKTEIHTHQIKTWLLLYALVAFAQVRLLRDQMKEAFTPSTMGRISFGTISAMLIVDGMTFTAAATWVSSAGATFLPTLALMFASFLSMTIGGSFLAKIYEVQLPESRDRSAPQGSSTPAESNNTTASNTGGSLLPGPVTAAGATTTPTPMPIPTPTPTVPIIVPSDQDIDAEIADAASAVPRPRNVTVTPDAPLTFQAIVGRFILFSLCVSFLAISSSTWYPRPRSIFLNVLVFVYLSMWVPQIVRNTLRNCRKALSWPFVIGQSLLRLLPIAYFWVKDDNFLYATTDVESFLLLCGWVWIQVVILAAQQLVGPRFGIPHSWTPDAWDYHPLLREDNVEAGGLPIGLVNADEGVRTSLDRTTSGGEAGPSEKRGPSGMRTIDCAICRELVEVPVVRAGEEDSTVSAVFARRMYMVTPCRHLFHTACLEGWMRFRLQCPICREDLPPI